MDLVYFSSGPRERVLNALLQSGHKVSAVFVTDPQFWPKVAPTVTLAESADIPVRIISKSELSTIGSELSGQTCLSVGFGYLFPPPFLEAVELCLNVHGTLLPDYAGARTLNWIIENCESESGVTVHKVDGGVDTGPILLQARFPLTKFDTVDSLYAKTLDFEPQVVLQALEMVEDGTARYTTQTQDHTSVVRYPDRVPEDSEIDPTRSLTELYDKIRAAPPDRFPAYFFVNGEKVCIRMWRPDAEDSPYSDLSI